MRQENEKMIDDLSDLINQKPDVLYKSIMQLDLVQAKNLQNRMTEAIADCIYGEMPIKNSVIELLDLEFENIIDFVKDGYIGV